MCVQEAAVPLYTTLCVCRKLICAVVRVKVACEETSRAGGKADWEEIIGVSEQPFLEWRVSIIFRVSWRRKSSRFGRRDGCRRGEGVAVCCGHVNDHVTVILNSILYKTSEIVHKHVTNPQ